MSTSLRLASSASSASLVRARARRDSDGAVMFIVVVTLGLLAVMGVYGLSAASADIKAAGHMREALQGQKAGEHALAMTAETFNPSAAMVLVQSMSGAKRTNNCKTATGDLGAPADLAPYVGAVPVPASAACIRLNEAEMRVIGQAVNPWVTSVTGFGPESFGLVKATPGALVEISNPVDVPPPPGSGYDPASQRFTQVTVTVFVEVRKTPTTPAETVVAGRGRMTVGPITGSAAAY